MLYLNMWENGVSELVLLKYKNRIGRVSLKHEIYMEANHSIYSLCTYCLNVFSVLSPSGIKCRFFVCFLVESLSRIVKCINLKPK